MKIPINKDPEKLNISVIGGRNLWQYACIIFSIGIAVVFVLLFEESLGATLSSIICLCLAAPAGYIGVFSRHGLDFFTYMRSAKSIKQGTFLYRSPAPDKPGKQSSETGVNKKIVYIIKNILTGGKNA